MLEKSMKLFKNCMVVLCVTFVFGLHSAEGQEFLFGDLPGPFWREGAEIELHVVDGDGHVVAGAEVVVGTDSDSAYLKFGRPQHPDRTPNTDSYGVYHLVLPDKFATVVITDDTGVAIIDPLMLIDQQGPMEVRLQPWSSVKGQLIDTDGQPIAGEQVQLWIGHWIAHQLNPLLDVSYTATTDSAGNFRFDRVPPGRVRVRHYTGRWVRGRSAVGLAEPGQDLKLVIGGGGRTVRGLLPAEVLAEQAPGKPIGEVHVIPQGDEDWVFNTMKIPTPIDHSVWSLEKRRAWSDAWKRSAQRLAFEQERAELSFDQLCYRQKVPVQPNGAFEIPDVLPGEYVLQVYLPEQPYATFPFDLAEVAPGSEGIDNNSFDLGLLPLGTPLRVDIGDRLPDFEFTNLPVTDPPATHRFSDFKGQYVLLDFWATWCGPCLREAPNVQEVVKTYADDDRLKVLCISIDRTPDRPANYVKAKSAGGIQAWLSLSQKTEQTKAFSIPHVPSIWLIGPDGTIIALDLFGKDIMTAVSEALDAAPNR
jgi:thiol-disulfide isomerase/thioredoxin